MTRYITFRNDAGRVHAAPDGENKTYCGREKNRRNGWRAMTVPATITCGWCRENFTPAEAKPTRMRAILSDGREVELPPVMADQIMRGNVGGYSIGGSGAVWPR